MDRREILYMYLPAGVVEWLATNNLENRCYYLIRQSAIIRWRILRRCEQGLNPYPPFIMREISASSLLTVFVTYAPTSDYDDEDVEAVYVELEKFYKEDHTFYKVIVGDFNAKIGPRRSPEELHIGTHGLEWNEQGERLSEFIMSTKIIHGNSQFQKPPSLRWTWESPGGQFHNEIDHIIFNRKYCLTDVSVFPKFYTGSDHRLLRARFRFSRQGEKALKFKKRSPRTTINWDLYTSLAGLWEDTVMDNIDEE
ncbi:unnamed protein product [Heligmosomoides polygyrus]|uniref:Endo/exonuclease/phosphatase domain-containing protein n=1 Tax=Heligmosomoides polygyrus TaxID=6339 RepID=A0A3P8EVF1_HELPZ|nr:unnamed protein product [Heligmosomoides polygyrus]